MVDWRREGPNHPEERKSEPEPGEYARLLADAEAQVFTVQTELTSLAAALHYTGNARLGHALTALQDRLRIASELLQKGSRQAFDEHMKAVDQSSTNMLNAALAVAQMKAEK